MRSNKIKDMIRSILPSKRRKTAREAKALTNRKHRRRIREALRDPEFAKQNLHRGAYQGANVSWRRAGDKLNHFMRWCKAITSDMNADDALSRVRSILPHSLVGDHAYSHWEWKRKPVLYRWMRPRPRPQTRQSFCDSTSFRLQRALAIAPDVHRALNETIKSRKQEGEPRRLLRGIHDVRSFVEDIAFRDEWRYMANVPDPFAVERRTTLEMIERIEKGGRGAALQFFCAVLDRSLVGKYILTVSDG